MSSLGVRILLAANRLLPRPSLPGAPDSTEYARWEYRTSDLVVDMWNTCPLPSGHALDLGCGLGGKTHRLADHTGPSVSWTGLDIAAHHLHLAEAYHREVGLHGVSKVAADALRLPFRDAAFDRIVTTDTLEHFPDPRTALREMRRCLRPEGRLLLVFNPWGSPRGSHLGDLLYTPWCQLWFSPTTLVEATLAAAEERAQAETDAEAAARWRKTGQGLADHFRDHVHPTRIADLRDWLDADATFHVEREWHAGPGPLRRSGWIGSGWTEEWLTASYGATLRPREG